MDVENNNTPAISSPAIKRTPHVEENNAQENKRLKENVDVVKPEDAHVTGDPKSTPTVSRPAAKSPKKKLQFQNNSAKFSPTKRKPTHNDQFVYGNYKNYYGKRLSDLDNFYDIRLDVLGTQPEIFQDKKLLDIGCNSGYLSKNIAYKFKAKSLVGLDIDRSLITEANSALKADIAAGKFANNISFVHGNYVLVDDVLLEIERPEYDVILCLSVTKWIQLNFCDAGLKQAFKRMFLQLNPGGKLILEPQSFDTYRRRKKLSETIDKNYNAIKFMPDEFSTYLLSPEVGFTSMELLGVPEHCKAGFKRPIQIFNKD